MRGGGAGITFLSFCQAGYFPSEKTYLEHDGNSSTKEAGTPCTSHIPSVSWFWFLIFLLVFTRAFVPVNFPLSDTQIWAVAVQEKSITKRSGTMAKGRGGVDLVFNQGNILNLASFVFVHAPVFACISCVYIEEC